MRPPVTLAATIQDISAVPGDPSYDASAGDVRNARVSFINLDNNSVIATNLQVGLVNSNDLKTGMVVYNWSVNIGTANSQSFTVGLVVSNYYTRVFDEAFSVEAHQFYRVRQP